MVRGALGTAAEDGTANRHGDTLTDAFSRGLDNDPLGLFEDAPAKAVVLNSDFTIAYANTKFMRLVGSSPLLADRSFEQFIVEEDLDRVMECARSAVAEPGAVRSVSFQVRAQEGELVEVNSSWRYSVVNERMLVELMNVTEERREERELVALLCHAEAGSRSEPVGIAGWTWDVQTQTVECSREYVRLYRLDPRTVRLDGVTWMNMIEPDDRPRIHQAIREALAGSGVIRIEFRARRPDGSVAWMASRGHVVFNEHRQPVQIVGKTVDVTNIRRCPLQRGESAEDVAVLADVGAGI
jgi:PAS domain S-box-containing protein